MNFTSIPVQPSPVISYLRVGKLLYFSLGLFIIEAYVYWLFFERAFAKDNQIVAVFWFASFLFALVHIFLVIMDGWSRYQNYKLAKDQLFIYGFNPRIAKLYMGSKCQRNAVLVASQELGLKSRTTEYYKKQGVKWFHYVPYFMIKDPLFLFKKKFWSRTFVEKSYQSRFNFQKMQLEYSA